MPGSRPQEPIHPADAFRVISVALDGSARSEQRLDQAIELSVAFGARLRAVFVGTRHFRFPKHGPGTTGGDPAQGAFHDQHEAALMQDRLAERARDQGLAFEWTSSHFFPRDNIRTLIEAAGLVVTACASHDEAARTVGAIGSPHALPLVEQLSSPLAQIAGVPVLALPDRVSAPWLGEPVLVAWDGSGPARRALGSAWPFLRRARAVVLCTVDDGRHSSHAEAAPADVLSVLGSAGIAAQAIRVEAAPREATCRALTAQAARAKAGLIVMGAYSHPRWQELLLGGVTRSMLDHSPLPILLRH